MTVIVDLARRRTLDIVPGRSKAVLKAWLGSPRPSRHHESRHPLIHRIVLVGSRINGAVLVSISIRG